MIIIIKTASFNVLRYIDDLLGEHLALYFLVGLLPWSSCQPTLCGCNPLDDLILGLNHWPIVTCAIPRETQSINYISSSYLSPLCGKRGQSCHHQSQNLIVLFWTQIQKVGASIPLFSCYCQCCCCPFTYLFRACSSVPCASHISLLVVFC